MLSEKKGNSQPLGSVKWVLNEEGFSAFSFLEMSAYTSKLFKNTVGDTSHLCYQSEFINKNWAYLELKLLIGQNNSLFFLENTLIST